jgi:hypothetical protein
MSKQLHPPLSTYVTIAAGFPHSRREISRPTSPLGRYELRSGGAEQHWDSDSLAGMTRRLWLATGHLRGVARSNFWDIIQPESCRDDRL